MLSGIPQGSILGLTLFTIFINDLPDCVQSLVKIFADDTKMYNNSENAQVLQRDLDALQEWSNKWQLFFNTTKCKVIHVGKKNAQFKYKMDAGTGVDDISELQVCDNEKDLGVIFDNKLSFDLHIQTAINKANSRIGIIRRSFDFLDKEIFLNLYKSLVRPCMEYGNVIWSPYLKSTKKSH